MELKICLVHMSPYYNILSKKLLAASTGAFGASDDAGSASQHNPGEKSRLRIAYIKSTSIPTISSLVLHVLYYSAVFFLSKGCYNLATCGLVVNTTLP